MTAPPLPAPLTPRAPRAASSAPFAAASAARPADARPSVPAAWRPAVARAALVAASVASAAAVLALVPDAPALRADPDFGRLMRAMALLKGALVAVALAAVAWRLARPAGAWRLAAYVALPAVAAASTAAMWRLVVPGTVAVLLHAAGAALVLVAWRDPDFVPAPRPR